MKRGDKDGQKDNRRTNPENKVQTVPRKTDTHSEPAESDRRLQTTAAFRRSTPTSRSPFVMDINAL